MQFQLCPEPCFLCTTLAFGRETLQRIIKTSVFWQLVSSWDPTTITAADKNTPFGLQEWVGGIGETNQVMTEVAQYNCSEDGWSCGIVCGVDGFIGRKKTGGTHYGGEVRQDMGWGGLLHHEVAIYSNPYPHWCQPGLLKTVSGPATLTHVHSCHSAPS